MLTEMIKQALKKSKPFPDTAIIEKKGLNTNKLNTIINIFIDEGIEYELF